MNLIEHRRQIYDTIDNMFQVTMTPEQLKIISNCLKRYAIHYSESAIKTIHELTEALASRKESKKQPKQVKKEIKRVPVMEKTPVYPRIRCARY